MEESKRTIYFFRISFEISLFAVIAFACNTKTFVTFTCTFIKVPEDIHK